MKLLLINPKFPESFWSFSWLLENILSEKKTLCPPLGLATVAALTPSHWDITIVDENIEPIDWEFEADIVGVCGMGVQLQRQKEILHNFRKRGYYTVAGGSYASLCPEEYTELVDTVIAGEAEYIWPQFCADYEKNIPQPLCRERGDVDLKDSPVPRYDLLKSELYTMASLQFSRGCPFRCEFCDIIVTFGRKPRTKSPEQIGRELDMMRSHGLRNVFFVDDNLIGHMPRCKKLLAFLAEYQKTHNHKFNFGTEASINMAADAELMNSFREANFNWVFIGIESPDTEALLETKKEQNTRNDLLESIRTIYSYGIDVWGGFIVGFDADDSDVFDRQYNFIVETGITVAMAGMLVAYPRTPLYERLERANRLTQKFAPENTGRVTNVIPLKMTSDELVEGYVGLHERLTEEKTIYQKINNKCRYLSQVRFAYIQPRRKDFANILKLLIRGILPGGYKRWYYFTLSMLMVLRKPGRLQPTIQNWLYAISIKAFVEGHLEVSTNTEEVNLKSEARRTPIASIG